MKSFIHFYSHSPLSYMKKLDVNSGTYKNSEDEIVLIQNGFSSVMSKIKNEGKIHFVNFDLNRKTPDVIVQNEYTSIPDENVDEVYISTTFINQFRQVYSWSNKYPNIKFIVGGAAADFVSTYEGLKDIYIPNNLNIISREDIRSYFNIENNEWSLELPDLNIKKCSGMASYFLSEKCYWDKCIFCHGCKEITNSKYYFNPRLFDKVIIPNYLNELILYIVIGSSTIEIIDSLIILDKFTDPKLKFVFFIRADKFILSKLSEVLPKLKSPNKFKFFLGVEYPSKKMYKYMKKGYDTKTVMDVCNIIVDNGSNLYTSWIVGWPNLDKQDLQEASDFIDKIPSNSEIGIRPLTELGPGPKPVLTNDLLNQYDRKLIQFGQFHKVYRIIPTNQEASEINKIIYEKLYEKRFNVIFDITKVNEVKS